MADNIVDWTKAEHVQARIARELMVANYGSKADFTGLLPPVDAWESDRQAAVDHETFDAVSKAFEAQLGR